MLIFGLPVHTPVRCGGKIIDRFEAFSKAAWLFIAAFEDDHFYGIIGLLQTHSRLMDPMLDNICTDSAMDNFAKTGSQFFPVYRELITERLYRMLFVKVLIQVVYDLLDKDNISSFHTNEDFGVN